MVPYSQIQQMTIGELNAGVVESKAELSRMKINHAVSPMENPNKLREMRKHIARLLTELRQREINNK